MRVFILSLAALLIAAPVYAMALVDVFSTGDNGELAYSLNSYSETDALIYVIEVPNVATGDVIEAHVEAEFTNELGRKALVSSAILIDTDWRSCSQAGGLEMTEYNGRNITPDMHHDTHTKNGIFVVPEGLNGRNLCIMYVAWARSFPQWSGDTITVEQDYGRLIVKRYR